MKNYRLLNKIWIDRSKNDIFYVWTYLLTDQKWDVWRERSRFFARLLGKSAYLPFHSVLSRPWIEAECKTLRERSEHDTTDSSSTDTEAENDWDGKTYEVNEMTI